jgi:hypothetical protein
MKTKVVRNIIFFIVLLSTVFSFSCKDYLDIVPDNTATVDHAFKKRLQAEAYLYGLYSFLPLFARPDNNPAFLAGEETWLVDGFVNFSDAMWRIAKGEQGTEDPLCNYWASEGSNYSLNGGRPVFTGIRDCNIFLENIHKVIDLDQEEKEKWIAEVKTLKAFFHFWLLNLYGPVPIIDKNLEISTPTEETMYYREPVDSVVNYIVGLIDSASQNLPLTIEDVALEMGRINRPIALAIKAKVLAYAASPLYNGNPLFTGFKDKRGVNLFSQTYDPDKWRKAADALKEAIDVCHEAGHTLFDFNTLPESNSIKDSTVLAMQVRGAATERWNPEMVWGDAHDPVTVLQRFGIHAFVHWNTNNAYTYMSWAPTLGTVKQFYTSNGVPIEEDKNWTGVNPYELKTAGTPDKYFIESGYTTINLHLNREPRFYGSMFVDGGKYYGNGVTSDASMYTSNMKYTAGGVAWFKLRHSSTGYLVKKMVHRLSSLSMTSSSSSIYRYAFPVIRLADLYLLYAEALNEIKPTPDQEVYTYIDLVRNRTGLQGVVDSWKNYSVVPDKPATQDGMRKIIQQERLIELAFEGQRYWDLRRWMLLKEYMNKPIQGWNIFGKDAADFYQLQTIYNPKFEDKDYLWPIRQGNLLKNKNLVQNPGW